MGFTGGHMIAYFVGILPEKQAVFLLEVTLQHALQSNAVTSLVAGHFMDGLQNAAFQAAYLQGAWMAFLY